MAVQHAEVNVQLAPTSLGWIAVADGPSGVLRVTFGYETPDRALAALPEYGVDPRDSKSSRAGLIVRLQRFLDGHADDFRDVTLDLQRHTAFQRAVIAACRRIPRGRTRSYGDLAGAAGSPRAARAVGSVMSGNCFPLIVPCHRVVAATTLGGFSSPRGLAMKERLLQLEGALKTSK